MIEEFNTPRKVNKAFGKLKNYWNGLLANLEVKTEEKNTDRMVNIWNQYQCLVTYNLARSASYFESGISRGIGFRDSNQDLLGVVHMIPERAEGRLKDLASIQFKDGSTYHQYQPLTGEGNDKIGSGFNDDPLWLLFAAIAYIKETGNYSILEEEVPFNGGREADFFTHLVASWEFVINNLGPHGLPLIGHADWNDCLNLNCFSDDPDESFQTADNKSDSRAESVMIAGMFMTIGPDFAKLCRLRGKNKLAGNIERQINKMETALEKYGRDDEWFLRAYNYYGEKVGSRENRYGRIYIEPQGFCVMGGVGIKDGFAEKALNSVARRLNTEFGLLLLAPAYRKYQIELGEISSYPPGHKENGGIFCHNNPWIMIAETIIGRGERAFEYYRQINPAYLEDISDIHRTEPYVYAQIVSGKESPDHGEAKNSWLTGSAAWNFVAITQWILGVRPEFEGLRIDPCIPQSWDDYRVTRKFRGDIYNITVINPDNINRGVRKMMVDGKVYRENIIKPFKDNKEHNVKVIMGD